MCASSKDEKSRVSCANNQLCLFNHSVIAHAVAETVLCANSRLEIKERRTMIEENTLRKSYSQNWSNYNLAQTTEKTRFLELLYELCSNIEDLPRKEGAGRARLPMRDMLFAVVFKVYSTVSGRRFMSDLKDAHQKGYISRIPHFNSIFNYLESDEMYGYLKELITESAMPLKGVEINFAVDSSGFATAQTVRWMHAKYSKPHYIDKADWLKCHLMCGVSTNIVTSVEVTERYTGDSTQFAPLVEQTARNFTLNHVTADKAYLSAPNLRLVNDKGGIAFIPFKSNSRLNNNHKEPVWANMFHFYHFNREKFMQYYHRRSNVETTFSMIKGKFGERLRSKTQTAQINEILCKVLCHNICCVIQSIYELGISPEFLAV